MSFNRVNRLAISFCNTRGPGSPLLVIADPDNSVNVCVAADDKMTSACGMAHRDQHLYLACSNSRGDSSLAVIDARSLQIVDWTFIPRARDVHSICLDHESVIVASTGTDEVLRLHLRNLQKSDVLWRAAADESDTQHVNSVAWHRQRLLCSAFGRRTAERWYTARQGYIVDIVSGELIMDGLYHPHSIVSHAGHVYVCESSASRVVGDGGQLFKTTNDYLRGLAVKNGLWYIGSSIGRTDSTLPNEVLNPADPGIPSGRCGVHVLQIMEKNSSAFVDLTPYGREIYDILPLDF